MPTRYRPAVLLLAFNGWSCGLMIAQSPQSPPSPRNRDPTPPTPTGNGSIVGVVVNQRHEPVARATVQAFPALATAPVAQPHQAAPPLLRASGSASTDAEARFRISGLESGDYLVAAEPVPLSSHGASSKAEIYASTFYPSALDDQQAVRVSAFSHVDTTILIELVRVRGARVSGSVVSASGHPTGGMSVRLFHRFGGFGSESSVGVVDAKGTFEIPRVPPGWYRLTIGTRSSESKDGTGEFAEKLIDVQDGSVLSLVEK
jgi:hypothetical protein